MSPEQIERARVMQAEGRTVREIAAALKHPKSTIGRALAPPSQNVPPDAGPRTP
jgi:IS30 family transposase